MKKKHIQQILFTTVVILAGCANNGPAPVSDLNRSYSNTSRGEYRGSYYKVQEGDTLYFISYITDKNVNDLIAYNGLTPPYTIYPGQRLNLWRPAYRAPQYGRNTSPVVDKNSEIPISKTPNTPSVASSSVAVATSAATVSKNVASSITKNSINNSKNEHSHDTTKNKSDVVKKDPVKSIEPTQAKGYGDPTSKKNVNTNIRDTNVNTDQKVDRWLWPTKGRVIRKFSTGDQGNKGIDIAGQRGQAIVSTANGSVVYSGNALRGYGNLIIIKHNDNYLSAYAHNDRLLVKEGQNVVAGQKIATMGSSGTSSVRLHFEIRYQGKSMNPSRYLPK